MNFLLPGVYKWLLLSINWFKETLKTRTKTREREREREGERERKRERDVRYI